MAQANPFIVIVEFRPKASASREDCKRLLTENASTSLRSEPGCLRFDVVDIRDAGSPFYLYEIYRDEAAFEFHLDTGHYRDFSIAAEHLFGGKTVHTGVLATATDGGGELGM